MRALAYDVQLDGIYYNLNKTKKTATVTYLVYNKDDNYNAYSGDISVPSSFTYNGTTYSVDYIGTSAFYNCSGMTSIKIPNTIKSIGKSAFYRCRNLEKVIIPDIAAWCALEIEDPTYSTNPLYYANHLYSDEDNEILELEIPDNVTNVNNYVFSGCNNITKISIPNNVRSIGAKAFAGCTKVTAVCINSNAVLSKSYYDDQSLKRRR